MQDNTDGWKGLTLNRAIKYTDKRWEELTYFANNPDVALHNNPAEQRAWSIWYLASGFYEAGITSIRKVSGKALLLGNHSFEANEDGFENVFTFSNYSGLSRGEPEALKTLLTDEGFKCVSNIVGFGEDAYDEKCWSSGFLDDGILSSQG